MKGNPPSPFPPPFPEVSIHSGVIPVIIMISCQNQHQGREASPALIRSHPSGEKSHSVAIYPAVFNNGEIKGFKSGPPNTRRGPPDLPYTTWEVGITGDIQSTN